MKNLIFSLNATVPVFLLMALGFLFRKLGWLDEVFASKMNQFVFLVPLPLLVFEDLASVDFQKVWNLKFVLFCFFVTLASIALAGILSLLWKDRGIRGEFIQASYRSSAALLGIAFIQNIYGNAGMAPVMIIGSVPLYNIMAVVVLSFFKPGQSKIDKEVLKKTLKGIITKPDYYWNCDWTSLVSMPSSIFRNPAKTVTSIGNMATPMGLMAMGATFDIHKASAKAKPSIVAAVMKLVGFAAVFLPIAVGLGFKNEEIVAILVMLGSATTVSSYVMAKIWDMKVSLLPVQ